MGLTFSGMFKIVGICFVLITIFSIHLCKHIVRSIIKIHKISTE